MSREGFSFKKLGRKMIVGSASIGLILGSSESTSANEKAVNKLDDTRPHAEADFEAPEPVPMEKDDTSSGSTNNIEAPAIVEHYPTIEEQPQIDLLKIERLFALHRVNKKDGGVYLSREKIEQLRNVWWGKLKIRDLFELAEMVDSETGLGRTQAIHLLKKSDYKKYLGIPGAPGSDTSPDFRPQTHYGNDKEALKINEETWAEGRYYEEVFFDMALGSLDFVLRSIFVDEFLDHKSPANSGTLDTTKQDLTIVLDMTVGELLGELEKMRGTSYQPGHGLSANFVDNVKVKKLAIRPNPSYEAPVANEQ